MMYNCIYKSDIKTQTLLLSLGDNHSRTGYPSQHSISNTHILLLILIITILFMGLSRNASLLSTFLIILFSFSFLVCALDTITPSQLIKEPETVSSLNSMFTLGFFSPQNSTNRYVGIWFMAESNVVWIANRNEPLRDSSGTITMSENGNLVVLSGQNQVVWSTNVSNISSSNSIVKLLDSGNLVLTDRASGNMVWQSFKNPCNTLLPDMKLSTNPKTGEKVEIKSWKSDSDQSFGRFSATLESHNVTEVFVWEENRPYWRSGPWNGHVFLGLPKMVALFLNGFRLEEEEGAFDLFFNFANKSILRTFTLNSEGKIEERLWDFQAKKWQLELIINEDSECDVYGICGPFGICDSQSLPICSCLKGFEPKNKEEWDMQNWVSGCVRKEALQCERVNDSSQASKADRFLKLEMVKVPDFAEWLLIKNKGWAIEENVDCETPCLRNCSCTAYAYAEGLGCMFWRKELLDIQSFSYGGVDLYIRLAYSELGSLLSFFC